MDKEQNKLEQFWNELKRRKVVRVIMVYLSAAFVIIELVNNVYETLHLPDWTPALTLILLLIGFPIAIIFSWIFDITPQGIEITGKDDEKSLDQSHGIFSKKNLVSNITIGVLLVIVVILAYPKVFSGNPSSELEKSIAVLPFIDDSQEEGNDYIINGLMDAILNNLCKIQDLSVRSRTSVEKYRNNPKQITEIAKELNVKYIVEGSGQKNGDKVLLTVYLNDAASDKQLWTQQYKRNANNIIDLQVEVAKAISDQIQVKVTPEEKERIEKLPTENSEAYDLYTKGNEIIYTESNDYETLQPAISYYEKAIELDNGFALAYAKLSLLYSDLSQTEDEKYLEEANKYADLALLADPQSSETLFAKGVYYFAKEENDLAITYLENSMHYTPNYYPAVSILQLIYSLSMQNFEKSIEYGFKAIKREFANKDSERAKRDSTSIAYNYISLAETFRWAGFFDTADECLNNSQKFIKGKFNTTPDYVWEKEELILDTKSDYEEAKSMMLKLIEIDSSATTTEVMARNCYFLREWENAYNYYKKMANEETSYLNARLSFVCIKTGRLEEAETYIKEFEDFLNYEKYPSKFRFCQLYAYQGKQEEALGIMRFYITQDNFPYYVIRYFRDEPIYDDIRDLPEFKEILTKMETKFWANNERIKANLEEKRLL